MWIRLNHMNDRKISYLLTLPFTIMVPSYKNSHCFKNLTSFSSTQISMLWSTSLQWVIRSHILQKSCLQMKQRTGYCDVIVWWLLPPPDCGSGQGAEARRAVSFRFGHSLVFLSCAVEYNLLIVWLTTGIQQSNMAQLVKLTCKLI